MEFLDAYFEDEVRDGFYVPAMMKRAWAAELEVLSEIDKICQKHQIPYFAEWGSMLGTIRHRGFVPWDDDLDISMKRKDYERFLEVAEAELPDGFAVYNYKNHDDFWHFLARVVGKQRICFEPDHLERFHEFPYICGVDIFVLDYVSSDSEKESFRKKMAEYVLAVADSLENGKLEGEKLEDSLKWIEKNGNVSIRRNQETRQLRKELYQLTERLFAAFSEEESDFLTQMMPCGLYGNTFYLPKEYYKKALLFPFENTTMPVPAAYDMMLRKRYGEYMTLVRNSGSHGYPFFEGQHKKLEALLDFELPKYKFSWEDVHREPVSDQMTYKKYIRKNLIELTALCEKLEQAVLAKAQMDSEGMKENSSQEETDSQELTNVLEILVECQRVAIEMGNAIEEYKGEGMSVIPRIEAFCEWIFKIYECVSQEEMDFVKESVFTEKMGSVVLTYKKELLSELEQIREGTESILVKKEVVFLPFKASYWESLDCAWEAAMEDPECDVYVVPIPYSYKKYDGTLYHMQFDPEAYPEKLTIIDYESFDLRLHHPDKIIFQNPYDEFHDSMSVPVRFHSQNLKEATDCLVYIPYFTLEEFTRENEREYFNMRYYCCVPGVVRADRVMVQSEEMKNRYVEKLTEFAGENTKHIWEEKILGSGSSGIDRAKKISKAEMELPKEWENIIFDTKEKKVILFYLGVSLLIQDGEKMIHKLKNVLQTFYENKEEIVLLWKDNSRIGKTLLEYREDLYRQYIDIVENYKSGGWGIFDESDQEERAVRLCDAYYGDSSPIVQKCRNRGLPVMILNDDV